jgi:prepilin-type processing-associated H-X9-DG protein
MSTDFYRDLEFFDAVPEPRLRRRFPVIELLFVFGIIAVMIAASMDRVYHCDWPAARRAQCQSNLHQIALALRMYEAEYKTLPPAFTVDAQGRPLHSWRTLILPYLVDFDLENKNLYASINLSKPWNDPTNATAQTKRIGAFHCPESRVLGNATTSLAIVADNGCLLPTKPRPVADILDDHGSTLMVIEVDDEKAIPWMAPMDADEELVLSLGLPKSNLHHSGGMNAAFVDGSIRFVKANTKPDVLRSLVSIAGGEKKTDLK